MNWETLGYTATICGAIQLIPEVRKALKTHHLRDVSWAMLCIMTISSTLWTIYGIGTKTMPLAISAAINGVLEIFLIVLKARYSASGRPLLHPAPVTNTKRAYPENRFQ